MEQLQQSKKRVMRRIYAIWFVKRVMPVFALEIGAFTVMLSAIQSRVSFDKIVANAQYRMSHHPISHFGQYVLNAVSSTEFATLVVSFGIIIAGAFFARDAFRVSRKLSGNFLRASRVT